MSDADLAYAAAVAEIGQASTTWLELSGSAFSALDRLPADIRRMRGLQRLNLSGTQIGDADLGALVGLTELQSLALSGTAISNAGLRHLAVLPKLESLYLSQTQIGDVGLAALAGMSALRRLYLSNTLITNLGLHHLTALRLRNLDLGGTMITDVSALAAISGLHQLYLINTQVRDLRPIKRLQLKGSSPFDGLRFEETAAVRLDAKLAELAQIKDGRERTQKTQDYLESLPPWPEPLPWLEAGAKVAPASPTRLEPILTRGGGVKTSATQIKFLLREPQMTRITAQGIAGQIRAALKDVQPVRGNQLPPPLQSLLEFADALDALGKSEIAPKAAAREKDLRLRIAQLEAIIARLTKELQESQVAITKEDGFTKNFPKEMARATAETLGFMMRVGTITGVVYFLGPTNPAVAGLISIWAALSKISK